MNSSVYFSPSSKSSSIHSIPPLFSIPPVSPPVSYPFHVLPRSPPPFLLHSILSLPIIQFHYSQSPPLLHFSLSPIPQFLYPIPFYPSIITSFTPISSQCNHHHITTLQTPFLKSPSQLQSPPLPIPIINLHTLIISIPPILHSRCDSPSNSIHYIIHFTPHSPSPLSLFSKSPTQLPITKKHQISLQTPLLCNNASHISLPREWPHFPSGISPIPFLLLESSKKLPTMLILWLLLLHSIQTVFDQFAFNRFSYSTTALSLYSIAPVRTVVSY